MNESTMSRGEHYPLSNITYDLISMIHNKSEALEAYEKYIADAEDDEEVSQLLADIRQQDEQHIYQLTECLSRYMGQQQGEGMTGASMGGGRSAGSPGQTMKKAGAKSASSSRSRS